MFCNPPAGDDDVVVASKGGDLEGYPRVVVSILEQERGGEEFSCPCNFLSCVVLYGPFVLSFGNWYLLSLDQGEGH